MHALQHPAACLGWAAVDVIADRLDVSVDELYPIVERLVAADLLRENTSPEARAT